MFTLLIDACHARAPPLSPCSWLRSSFEWRSPSRCRTMSPMMGGCTHCIGHNLVAHAAYSTSEDPPYAPTYIRVPGYPLFIAADLLAVRRRQQHRRPCGASGGRHDDVRDRRPARGRVDAARLGACGRTRVRTWALAIAAACPFTAIYVVTILTETLAMCLGMFAVLLATAALARLRDAGAQPARDETADSARPLRTCVPCGADAVGADGNGRGRDGARAPRVHPVCRRRRSRVPADRWWT